MQSQLRDELDLAEDVFGQGFDRDAGAALYGDEPAAGRGGGGAFPPVPDGDRPADRPRCAEPELQRMSQA